MSIRVQTFFGQQLSEYLHDVAQLRIEIFRSFPYLYDGTLAYEKKYLETYLHAPESLFVLAFDGQSVVGASTAIPLEYETEEIQRPFLEQHYDLKTIMYLGESVLQQPYRGHGIGVRFFEEREKYAQGRTYTTFCAVERSPHHPRRPQDYISLERYWQNRGYTKYPSLHTTLSWKELDEREESPKPMVFWMKKLS